MLYIIFGIIVVKSGKVKAESEIESAIGIYINLHNKLLVGMLSSKLFCERFEKVQFCRVGFFLFCFLT